MVKVEKHWCVKVITMIDKKVFFKIWGSIFVNSLEVRGKTSVNIRASGVG